MGQSKNLIVGQLEELQEKVLRLEAHNKDSLDALGIQFTIKDTEFLTRLLRNTNISGMDIDTVKSVSDKLNYLHSVLLEKGIKI
ncbi:MAG: hypothetical protein Unbinned5179contig1000_31 [Prokaryotic dsDNA virus sp.]|nr:MAG: hypothetical protein Unbinned5179contig1000_31 [Prokaryotic dsDNA virus sp.]|tara:strand:- start:399 stop:650 length:252 start_codon:yes stop_codon:yes gene_type:complete